jgi:hypothetical protein
MLVLYYSAFSKDSIADYLQIGKILEMVIVAVVAAVIPKILGLENLFLSLFIFTACYLPLAYWRLDPLKHWKETVRLIR